MPGPGSWSLGWQAERDCSGLAAIRPRDARATFEEVMRRRAARLGGEEDAGQARNLSSG